MTGCLQFATWLPHIAEREPSVASTVHSIVEKLNAAGFEVSDVSALTSVHPCYVQRSREVERGRERSREVERDAHTHKHRHTDTHAHAERTRPFHLSSSLLPLRRLDSDEDSSEEQQEQEETQDSK